MTSKQLRIVLGTFYIGSPESITCCLLAASAENRFGRNREPVLPSQRSLSAIPQDQDFSQSFTYIRRVCMLNVFQLFQGHLG